MIILLIKIFCRFFVDLWFLRYRECPYSGTVRIRLLSAIVMEYNCSPLIIEIIHKHEDI